MKREDVDERLKWKISDLYESDGEWEKDFDAASADTDFSAYKKMLGDREAVLSFLRKKDALEARLNRIALYASMRHDEDTANQKYLAYNAKVGMLISSYAEAVSFFEPEMVSYGEEYIDSLIRDKAFCDYDYMLSRLKKSIPHVLDEKCERIMALSSETTSSFYEIFGMIDNADLPLPEIEYDGQKTRMTHELYNMILQQGTREERKEAYDRLYGTYNGLLNTITATYYGNVRQGVFKSRVYGFDSCLERALFDEDVDRKVYDNLLKSVRDGFPALHRYVSDRKRMMGVDRLYFYDMYVSLAEDVEMSMGYDEAYNLVVEGLGVLGPEYQALLKKAHDERWLDVEETDNKRSGAYSTGMKGYHPYVLLNYKPTLNNIFTIAHEMGHSLHTYFSGANQPYAKSDYTIFVAEVASTVNEVLLLKYLCGKTDDTKLRKYLLNHYLDTIRTTLFRQTMFAEFEYRAHTSVEGGTPLTKEYLNGIYASLGREYYGDDIEHDYNISIEWSRIPHFYRPFYVYKYATGITAAINIADRILAEGDTAVKDYFRFLSAGSSADPVSLIKLAGVDLSCEEPFVKAMDEFEKTLEEFESL